MESVALRPRKATEIVDAAIEVYRRNPIHFLLLAAIVRVPWLIVQIVLVGGRENDAEALMTSVMIGAGGLVSYFLTAGLVVHMASELYLGRETDSFETIRSVWPKTIEVFVASILQTVAVVIGLLLLLFPAVWITSLIFAVIPAIVIEKKGVGEAFSRSSQLSVGMKGHVLSALGLVVLIRVIVELGIGIIALLIPMLELRYVLLAVAGMLIYPLFGIAEALIYYDVRIRKEGFDIEMLAQQPAQPAPAAV